ncbi:acyl carrier protein [Budviciaceae bacterium BWR-B9]|uniref:Acyl carrier protein n=1 Tax=Limnobaculum allomyrinae TaxID=2791986 RepID=A0ABS1IVM9_9GAMM|nr:MULTISPECIES: acyl carrier protein [Limnobaculum]MBK5145814.1 acyl carrier protein [Limnobaculum allomyrinae]MBV7693913.1 acyl carrier protein [Limnobaculum sp. M2-1]
MNYLHKSKEILSGCLSIPVEQIPDDSLIEQLKPTLDSVDFAGIMMQVERFLKKEVPVAEWLELGSVKDLADILERNHTS